MPICVLLTLISAAASPRLAIDFEHGTTGWQVQDAKAVVGASVSGPVKVVARQDKPANHCARLTGSARVVSPMIPYAGQRIVVRLSMRVAGVQPGKNHWNRAGAQVLGYGADRQPVKVHWSHWDVALQTGTWPWLPYERRLVLPQEVKYLRLQLLAWDIAGGEAYVDDASLELLPVDEPLPEVTLAVGDRPGAPVRPFWYGVDASHAERLRFPHFQRALDLIPSLGFRYVRVHTPLACIKYDKSGQPTDYSVLDERLRSIARRGLHVYFTFEPMPEALASKPRTKWCNISPPRDYDKWTGLCKQVIRHLEQVFGREEVRRWVFSVWNEPFAKGYFDGTHEDYLKVYEATVRGALAADEGLTICGLDGGDDDLTREFLSFVATRRLRCDLLTAHMYAGSGYKEAFPEVRWLPLHLGRIRQAEKAAGLDLPVQITECNFTSSPRRYSEDAHGAVFFARAIADFLHSGPPQTLYYFCLADHPYKKERMFTGGLGLITLGGVFKPTVNTFRMLRELRGRWLAVTGGDKYVGALAVQREDGAVAAVVWDYADDPEETQPNRRVRLRLPMPEGTPYEVFLLDSHHSNVFDEWEAMGSPQQPTEEQIALLRRAEGLERVARGTMEAGGVKLTLSLPSLVLVLARP